MNTTNYINELQEDVKLLLNKSPKQQLEFINLMKVNENINLEILFQFLNYRLLINKLEPNFVDGSVYRILKLSDDFKIYELLETHFKNGIVSLSTDSNLNYYHLNDLLIKKDFLEADKLTNQKLCELAQLPNNQRDWLYFSDIKKIPFNDLLLIDRLWQIYSEGKFGFSVQRKIWLSVNKDWNILWKKIGWKQDDKLSRYPIDFQWNLNAPNGHLPLSNQLRGNQVLNALFQLEIWEST
uniref:GUN4 protein n=1 Tax=Compsopogon caeruleus TaxID=31354 RepID=A0A1Z1XBG3_9RHOD|nr:GUN4 protein [Compsopogon caeruleus]ARX96166.1 GUN4 protein [Compsopogon caeruleus]